MGTSAYSMYGSARPAPKNWQTSQYQGAQDLWNAQGADVLGAVGPAAAGQAGAIDASGSALSRLTAFSPTALQNYQPTALQAYDPNQYLKGPSGAASTYAGANPLTAAPVAPTDWSAASGATGALENFDPSAAGKTFATGAVGQFNENLDTQLSALERKSAGTGRLETGFYTGDQGTVATNLGKDYNAQLAEAATTFSGQRESALAGAAGDYISIAGTQGQEAQAKANEQDYVGATGRAQNLGALTAEEQMGVSEQETGAQLGLSKANDVSNLDYTQARDTSSMDLQAGTTALQAALEKEQMARSGYTSAAGAAGAYTSATRNWAATDKQTQDEIDYQDALARYHAGAGGMPTTAGGGTLPDVYGQVGGSGPAAKAGIPGWLATEASQLHTTASPYWG